MQNSKINFQLATFRLQLLPTCNLQRGMQHRMSVTEKRVACELEISKAQQKKSRHRFYCPWGKRGDDDDDGDEERTTTGQHNNESTTENEKKNNNNKAKVVVVLMLLLLLLLALLSFLAPSSTMLLGESFANSCYSCLFSSSSSFFPSCCTSFPCHSLPLPLLPMSIALHFVVVDTRAGSQQGNLIVDSPLFCLTHSLTLTSRFPSLFLDFYALLVPCPFHICFSRFLMIGQIEFRLNLQSATAAAAAAIATSN